MPSVTMQYMVARITIYEPNTGGKTLLKLLLNRG